MNYTQLTTNIQDIVEYTFSADQLAMFVQQAEQKIYNSVQLPALRKYQTGNLTQDVGFLTLPTDYLHSHSISIDVGGVRTFLVYKDVGFIHEAYPDTTARGTPKYYAEYDDDSIIVGPVPDSNYTVHINYGYYPESIVTAGTTWLGEAFDSALLNGALIETIRFMKGEPDTIANYEKLYAQAIGLLKNLGDGKLREDTYRSGQFRSQVS